MQTNHLGILVVTALEYLLGATMTDSQTLKEEYSDMVRTTIRRIEGAMMEPLQPEEPAVDPPDEDVDLHDARVAIEILRKLMRAQRADVEGPGPGGAESVAQLETESVKHLRLDGALLLTDDEYDLLDRFQLAAAARLFAQGD